MPGGHSPTLLARSTRILCARIPYYFRHQEYLGRDPTPNFLSLLLSQTDTNYFCAVFCIASCSLHQLQHDTASTYSSTCPPPDDSTLITNCVHSMIKCLRHASGSRKHTVFYLCESNWGDTNIEYVITQIFNYGRIITRNTYNL